MISVIIPIYNMEAYLDKCLSSILTNTYRDLEVICVNDGSTDGCSAILQKWQTCDNRVIVIDQENLDLEEARNSGLAATTGDYIAFIDADDWIHPRYFELLLECMIKTDADMVVCGVREYYEGDDISVNLNPEPHYRKLTSEQLIKSCYPRRVVWGRLMRSRDALALRFPPEVRSAQDSLYNLRLIGKLDDPSIYELDSPLYYYLQRPGSRVHSHPYETTIQMSDWYVKHLRDAFHKKAGPWAWTLLFHSIVTSLSCRYQAYLHRNQEVIKKTNSLLRSMIVDLDRDRYAPVKYKAAFTIMFLFPHVYRLFRLREDPTLKGYEKKIRNNQS